jgi:hypothetical protein
MSRPATKLNPIKKTFYIETQTIKHLTFLAGEDKRSPSQYLENLIEADWLKRHGKAKPAAKKR